jgi:chromosomal replication initiator protein
VPLAFDEAQAVLRVAAPNRFKLDWLRKNLSHQIEVLATEWYERPVQVSFELASGPSAHRTPAAATRVPAMPQRVAADGVVSERAAMAPASAANPSPAAAATAELVHDRSRLNTDLTFDNFVTGKANQLARAAALQVAENPGVSYNPLFLYGGVGLGKTHLIHAIGNALLANGNGTRVRYVHADQYVSDVVKAYQRKAFDEFKRYYHSLDLLLIDDIQFFAGKNRTQEEFFYAFEAMVAQRKQIIITSDTYPKELSNIDSRLISRFDSGLTVAIEPPELEMRVAILLRKAE